MSSKKYTITKKESYSIEEDKHGFPEYTFEGGEDMKVSDGFHDMDELYEHRIQLYLSLCESISLLAHLRGETGKKRDADDFPRPTLEVWRSKYHSDGELCFGTGTQFVLGIGTEKGQQISYHIPIDRWGDANFARVLDRAPEFDGHTSADVLERLKNL